MEDFFSQLSLLPEMSDTFIKDIRYIIENFEQWLYSAIMDPMGQMCLIIYQYRYDLEIISSTTTTTTNNKQTILTNERMVEIKNNVMEHLVRLLNHKSRIFKDFSIGMQKQLEFINMIKVCAKGEKNPILN